MVLSDPANIGLEIGTWVDGKVFRTKTIRSPLQK